MPASVQAALRTRLAGPQGERGYRALWQWAQAEHGVTTGYSRFWRWAHDHLGATLKVARKNHGQKKTNSPPTVSKA